MTIPDWSKSWEVGLAAAVLVGGALLPDFRPHVTPADAALWFGCIVLGTGLLRDLWALFVTRAAPGEQEVAMCAESIVGAAAIAGGLSVLILGFVFPHLISSLAVPRVVDTRQLCAGLAASLVFSAWVHDLVFVKRRGRFHLERHRDHGSFVVHLFRGQAKACALGPPAAGPDTRQD